MENLDNKYFETVIMALKKAKATQKIEIRPDFKAKLRSEIESRALSMNAPEQTDWSDLILRYKYILGGVPVLAVLALVAVNALNFQVKMPKTQIVPVTGTVSESSAVQSGQTDLSSPETSVLQPKIKTFSADLVMPPAEYLENRGGAVSPTQTGTGEISAAISTGNSSYMFLDGLKVQLKYGEITAKQLPQSSVSTPVQQEVTQNIPAEEIVLPEENGQKTLLTSESALSETPAEKAARLELSGRVEQSGTVTTEHAGEIIPDAAQTADTLKTDTATQTQLPTVQPLIQAVPVPAVSLPEVRTESVNYINPVEEQKLVAPKMTIQTRTLNVETPQFLSSDRIYFDGSAERATVVEVVLKGLSSRNGNLSNDYYVNVVPLENGTYKATLYEFGQVKQVLILAQRDGKLMVVTELDY
jgi:hypothetical protein